MNKSILVTLFLSTLALPSAFAGVIDTDPLNIVFVDSASVADPLGINQLESDDNIFLIEEKQNFVLEDNLAVEQLISSPDNLTLDGSSTHSDVLVAGTEINSFLFHYDAITASPTGTSWTRDLSGRFTFDTEIIAVIWTGPLFPNTGTEYDLLGASDYLGNSTYTFTEGRGLEPESGESSDATQDFFTISDDLKTVDVNFKVMPEFSDHLRVITAAKIPEPTAILLFGSALALLGFRRFS